MPPGAMQWIKQNNVVSIAVIGSEDVETYVPSQILKEEAKKKKNDFSDFPGGSEVKNWPRNAGDTGLIPPPGRSHMPGATMS